MPENLKEQICLACERLAVGGFLTGQADRLSAIDRQGGKMLISPSAKTGRGFAPAELLVVDFETGEVLEGNSADVATASTHMELYRAFSEIGSIACVSSPNATAWAQAMRNIPVLGTIHAENFQGPVPCTLMLSPEEFRTNFELNIARAIEDKFEKDGIQPLKVPAVLVAGHQPYAFGENPQAAAENAFALEKVALLAGLTISMEPYPRKLPKELLR